MAEMLACKPSRADVEEGATMSDRAAARINLKVLAVGFASMLCIPSADALSGDEVNEQCLANKQMIAGYVAGALDKAAVDSDILFRFYFDTYDVLKTAERIEKDNRTLTKSSLALDGYCIPEAITLEQKQVFIASTLLITRHSGTGTPPNFGRLPQKRHGLANNQATFRDSNLLRFFNPIADTENLIRGAP